MKKMKKLLLALVLLISINVSARTFYVSQFGDDTRTVTQAQSQSTPWQTLSKIQSNVANGDIVLFAKGSKFEGTLSLDNKTNIYFGVYGTGTDPLFWGTGGQINSLVTLIRCTNITFYGWNISDTTISFSNRYIQAKIQIVFTFDNTSTNNVIRKCTMDRIGYGAYITETSPRNTMDSSDIGNLRMIRNTPGGNEDYGGVPVQISSSNNTITNNYFHDCYARSYDYNFDGGGVEFFEEGVVIENNVIAYNTFYECNGVFEFGSSADGIANNLIRNNKIYYNKFINNNTVVYINNNSEYRTKVVNLQFYNNVMLQTVNNTNPTGSSGIMFSMMTGDATAGIIVLKNNIIQISNGLPVTRSGQFDGVNLTHTNNIYKLSNGTVTNFTLGVTEIANSGVIWTNTSNTNPLNWDYRLTITSQAINNGVYLGLTRDFSNNLVSDPPDIGILEYGGTPPPACSFTYGTWSACINNIQTRSYTSTPLGCSGTPDPDSIRKTCTSPIAIGRKYYFSTSGSDANNGLSPATPWQTLRKLQTFSTSALPGDTFAFKCGDVFANGNNRRIAMEWNNTSGTATNPIVFTYYGDLTLGKPNFLFPRPTSVPATDRYNMCFKNAAYLVFDGLQFNDFRFPVNDKVSSAYTASGLMFGENMDSKSFYCTIRNSYFSNIGYGILGDCDNCTITNNTFTNFKSVGDTFGINDIGADALQISGKKYRITNNYISGSWAYSSGTNSSSNGLLGGALETINDFDSSFIGYNIFIDNSGGMEGGQNRGTQYGANDDTFAYNLFINNSNVVYINTTNTFKSTAARLHFWNNVIIENEKSRFTGRNNGGDALGNGQTYTSTGFLYWPPIPPSKSTFTPQEYNYYSSWRTFDCGDQSFVPGDTLYDIKNNIIWNTNGLQLKSSVARRPKDHYRNNIYHIKGSYQLATNLGDGAVLDVGEKIINGRLFLDTSNAFPQNWDFHIVDTSSAKLGGVNVGILKDFGGNTVSGIPTVGIYQYSAKPTLTFTSTNVTCKTANNGTITASASGGTSPYLYKINNLTYRSSGSFTGLAPNTYTVYVKDSKGVVTTLSVTIKSSNVVCP